MKTFTLAEYLKNPKEAWLVTFNGAYRVGYVTADLWINTPAANAGFGSSWCCHGGTTLYPDQASATAAFEARHGKAGAR